MISLHRAPASHWLIVLLAGLVFLFCPLLSRADNVKTSNDRLNQGLALFNKGRYNDALKLFQQAIAYNPTNSYAFNDIAACYINLNEDDSALPYLMQSLRLNSTYTIAVANAKLISNQFLDQGNALIGQGQYNQAVDALRSSLEANPHNAMSYNDLGCISMDLKQWSSAIPYLKASIHVGGASYLPYRNLGITYDQTSAAEALPYYIKALQFEPSDSEVWGWCGYDHDVTGDASSALYDYTRSLHIKPSADVYHWRGILELNESNDASAYSDLRKARSMNPDLGPVIDADIKSVIAAHKQQSRYADGKQEFMADERAIASIVAEGPHYYHAIYAEAIDDGESNEEANEKLEQAQQNYYRDVALQNAWEANDYSTLDKIEAGEMSTDDIESYNSSDALVRNNENDSDSSQSNNDNNYQPSDNDNSTPTGDVPTEEPEAAPSEGGGGDE